MKIAFVNQPWNKVTLPVQSGSIAIWTYEVARRLASAHHVVVFASRHRQQKALEWADGVEYKRVTISPDLFLQRATEAVPFNRLRSPLSFESTWYYLGYIVEVATELRRSKPDIVHIHNFSQYAPIVRLLNPSSAIIMHMHCEWLTQIDRRTAVRRLRNVDKVIGCSRFIADGIRTAFSKDGVDCSAVQNGVDTERFRVETTRRSGDPSLGPKVLFVGRLSPEKGVHVLLEAFQRVLERIPEARLELVGPWGAAPAEFIMTGNKDPEVEKIRHLFVKDYLARLKNIVAPEAVRRVEFSGDLPYIELAKRYAAADVFVYPSVWNEPFGLPVAEAMACGLPVVGSRSGGLCEIVDDGVTGLLVDRGNVGDLVNALVTLLSDGQLRHNMGRAGRERVSRLFSWEKVAEDLDCLYGELRSRREKAVRGGE